MSSTSKSGSIMAPAWEKNISNIAFSVTLVVVAVLAVLSKNPVFLLLAPLTAIIAGYKAPDVLAWHKTPKQSGIEED